MTATLSRNLQRRFMSVASKVRLLSSLRESVGLRIEYDISENQWSAIESPLRAIEAKLHTTLKRKGGRLLGSIHDPGSRKELTRLLGNMELTLSKYFTYFDTFVDLLSQRHLPEMGLLLGGCDVLAWDSLKKDHPALSIIEEPLVSFNRGFGASILREGVRLPDGTPNPLATIQIPYTKLRDKYNLTSVVHETGHSAMVQLDLIHALPDAVRGALSAAGASKKLRKLYGLWCKEIGPDFWGFCNCGAAQASSVMEILTLPASRVFRISPADPHPPPFLRVLLACEWCRHEWGRGDWDNWEREWVNTYPLEEAPEKYRAILTSGLKFLPAVSRALFRTRFRMLGNRTIPSLFDIESVSPVRLNRIIEAAEADGILDLSQLTPCGQLALFRMLRNRSKISEKSLDRLMSTWLITLAQGRTFKERYSRRSIQYGNKQH